MERANGIPDRSVFKAAEVCEIAGVKAFVLRSWQKEFPELGQTRGRSRTYRRADIELVLQIKRLLYEEGLTLGAVRRQIDAGGPAAAPAPEAPPSPAAAPNGATLGPEARERILGVKRGLEAILGLLSANGDAPASASRAAPARRRPRRRAAASAP